VCVRACVRACVCLTSARVLDLVRVEELHEHLEGLSVGLSDGHLQHVGSGRLDCRDVPGAGPLLPTLLTALLLNLLHTQREQNHTNITKHTFTLSIDSIDFSEETQVYLVTLLMGLLHLVLAVHQYRHK